MLNELEWNGSKYVATLTDTNGVLGNYTFSANIDGVTFSTSGNKLTVSMDTAPSKEFTITATKKNGVRRGVIVWSDGKDKNLSNQTLSTVGYGDRGGTTPEMIEIYRRLEKGIPGMPGVKFEIAVDFFEEVEKKFKKSTRVLRCMPKWAGKLYLELHKGTYTSMAKNKRYNRKSELLYQEAEILSVTDMVLLDGSYSKLTLKIPLDLSKKSPTHLKLHRLIGFAISLRNSKATSQHVF